MYDFTLNFNGQSVSGAPGGGKPNRAKQAAHARHAEQPGGGKHKAHHGKGHGDKHHGDKHHKAGGKGDGNAQLTKAAGQLLKAAQQLSSLGQQGGMGLPGMGGFPPMSGCGCGYGPSQALALGQNLGNGFAQFAGGGPSINFNFNNCFNGSSADSNPFASSFASSFGDPCSSGMGPQLGAMAMAFSC